ncbi:MAG: YXWGXW repeat-containing protein [Candidatus Acidiferrales bacterium]
MRITWLRLFLVALAMLIGSTCSYAQIRISVSFGPPELPVYEQPLCPGEGYIWAPGYWAWAGDDYYWVPGTWVLAPEPGLLWTPGYWGWDNGDYVFYNGYWAPTVGFYGGIDYGYGYTGRGYEGGRWEGNHFYYNRSVNNVNVTNIHNVYNTTVINNTTVTRVSYNGGNGGVEARPTPQEEAAAHERHVSPVAAQVQHAQEARSNPELRASANHGKPPIAATPKPAVFKGQGVVAAKEGGPYHPAAETKRGTQPAKNAERSAADDGRTAVHPKELPPVERHAAPSTGNAKQDQKYQQQQEKLAAKQEQARQKLQAKQDQEHQRLAQQKANDAQKQQVEQKHQQQTQNLSKRQAQQQQDMQRKEQPARPPAHPPQQQEKPRPPQ